MAEQRQVLDVWVVETNTVYRQVPFTVVVDWVQQGRLLEDDQLRPPGQTDWVRLAAVPSIAAYLPRATPHRAEDQAEALEPVEVDFTWKPRHDGEDDDVDMIPLIDVSLVLLIFFMMTASVTSAASLIQTPEAPLGSLVSSNPRMLWIGIDRNATGETVYSFGQGDQGPAPENRSLTQQDVLNRLDQHLKAEGPAEVRIKANRQLPYEVIKKMTLQVERRKPRVTHIYAEVSVSQGT